MILEHPVSKQSVESYRFLVIENDFSWTSTHIERQKIKGQIREYQEKLSSLHKLKPSGEDVKKNALADLLVLRHEIIKRVAAFLDNNRRAANPFSSRIDRLGEFLPAPYLTEDMIEEAVSMMPKTEDCMPIAEKRKKISALEKKLETQKGKLAKASPPEHFSWVNGQPHMDLCQNFEKKWRSIQGRLNQPCCVLGFDLKSCKESEQAAWRDLRIRSAMNERAKLSPIPWRG